MVRYNFVMYLTLPFRVCIKSTCTSERGASGVCLPHSGYLVEKRYLLIMYVMCIIDCIIDSYVVGYGFFTWSNIDYGQTDDIKKNVVLRGCITIRLLRLRYDR